jgi:1-acyl-sn-glycerol-3-phosphate acyltransferase
MLRWGLLQAIRPFLKLTIIGLENVPPQAPFLFVANHLHNADPILFEIVLKRPVHFMAKQELFRNPILAWLIRRMGTFPVDRGRPDRAAIRHAEALLANGVPVGMFPEGTRSTTGALRPAFPGAGLIAIRARVDVLPAAIIGTEHLSFKQRNGRRSPGGAPWPFQRPKITIRFGSPVSLEAPKDGSRLNAAAATDAMMHQIARLLPEQYQGVYAASSRTANPDSQSVPPAAREAG